MQPFTVNGGSPIQIHTSLLPDARGVHQGMQVTQGYYHPEGNVLLRGQGLMRSMRPSDGYLKLEFEQRARESYVIETKTLASEAHRETWRVIQGRAFSRGFQVPVNKENTAISVSAILTRWLFFK